MFEALRQMFGVTYSQVNVRATPITPQTTFPYSASGLHEKQKTGKKKMDKLKSAPLFNQEYPPSAPSKKDAGIAPAPGE
ncbi:hypothetical protein JCM10550A_20460 [Methanogenium cariaci]|jgi:hypothetical protein